MNSPNPLSGPFTIESTYAKAPDLLVIARALWAGKWQIAGIIAVVMGLAAVHIATAEPKFTARTILSLEGPERRLMNFERSNDNPAADEKKLETEAEVLRSRGLVEKLVQQLSLVDDPEFNPSLLPPEFPSVGWALDRLRQWTGLGGASLPDEKAVLSATMNRTLHAISANPIFNTYLIEIYVETSSPEKSAEIANTLARLYIVARRESGLEANSEGTEWLTRQVGKLKAALEAAERKVWEFRDSAEVTSPEALQSQNEQLKALRDRYLNMQANITLSESRMALLDDVLKDATPETAAAVAADPILSKALGVGEASGLSPSVDNGPTRQLARIVAGRIEAERDRERSLAETTAAAIADLETRVERQSREMVQLRQLEREVDANAAIYEFALNRLKQLSVERGIEQTPVRIVSKAEPPLAPSGPSAGVVAALAVVLGGFLGTVAILVRQGVQDSFRTAEEIERLSSIPVLGQVLALPTSRRPWVMKSIVSNDASPFSESIRTLRTSILAITGTKRIVIVLSSAMPGEGKTTLSLALARSMSSIGKTVLVIDADLRGGMLKGYLRGQKKSAGLVAAIKDQTPISELVSDNEALEADVLLSETSHYNAADLFALPDLGRVLGEARSNYDITIVDTPPTLLVPDAKLIAPHADMVLMAVRWNHTTKWQLIDAMRELQMANCVINGFVMTRTDPKGMTRFGYGDRRGLMAAYRSGYYK